MESLGTLINVIIITLAVITAGGFIWVKSSLDKIVKKRDEKHKKGRSTEYTQGGIVRTPDAITWEETLDEKEVFDGICVKYQVVAQFIPIFPLLGILGTVAGLILQMNTSGIEQMREALGTSMWTTFWGLVAAISLKLVDALFISNSINKMDNYFENFEQNYHMVRDKKDQETK